MDRTPLTPLKWEKEVSIEQEIPSCYESRTYYIEYVKQTDSLVPSFFDYSERGGISVSNTGKMTNFYIIDNQHIRVKTIFKCSDKGHFTPKSKPHLPFNCSTFTR
jgi:hypothetical protein